MQSSGARIVKVTGIKGPVQTVSIVVRGANAQILDETERSLHDAQCAIRCLVKKKQVFPRTCYEKADVAKGPPRRRRRARDRGRPLPLDGGAQPDGHRGRVLARLRRGHGGGADHAGRERGPQRHPPIVHGSCLAPARRRASGNAGVSVKSGGVKDNIVDENVLQPLLVSTSAVELAAETVKMILRIDDIALSR